VDTTSRPRWAQRRFVALGVLFSGLAMPVTGLADHLARDSSGPNAATGWAVVHIALGTLFVVFGTWHAALNRRALLSYLRDMAIRPARSSRVRPLPPGPNGRVAGAADASAGAADASADTSMPPDRPRRRPHARGRRRRRAESPFVALDRSQCDACWDCIAVCPESVFGKVEVWRHRHAVVNAGDRCSGCRRCVKACAAGALSDRNTARRPRSAALAPSPADDSGRQAGNL
jgi:Pyruvate/2-oxoacid:ferredoxin oxidoreductase delta subunit